MNTQCGQASLETIVVLPFLIIGGLFTIGGAQLVYAKSLLTLLATERASLLASTELQWMHLENLNKQYTTKSSTSSLRFYVTHLRSPVAGVSVQLNACVPLFQVFWHPLKSASRFHENNRSCLGMYESGAIASAFRTKHIRIRVAAFAPQQESHAIFHHGIHFSEKNWSTP
jgi:hypothetical protein